MKILFVTSNRLGDVVLSTGLLGDLLDRHPGARITVACGPVAETLFSRMPGLDRLVLMEKRRFGLHWLPLWLIAVRTRWDLVVDIRGSALSWLVRTRARAAMRGGTGPKIEQLAAVLGLHPAPLPRVWTAPEDDRTAARLLPGGVLIGLGPTANWTGKVWPPVRFAALFRALAEQLPGAVPVVFAGPGAGERALAAPLLALLPEAVDLVGRLDLPQAAACLARCALFVGNDSGLMHLAAAAGAPTLGLFGPTPAAEYAPAGPRALAVCGDGPGMDTLSVAAALAGAERLLPDAYAAASPRPLRASSK